MSDKLRLKCKILTISSNDNDEGSPLNILNNDSSTYWVSSRFCRYPQYIFIQFNYPTIISQIKILFHEYKIPSKINFYSFCPDSQYDYLISDLIKAPMTHIGYVTTETNEVLITDQEN